VKIKNFGLKQLAHVVCLIICWGPIQGSNLILPTFN